MGKLSLKNQIRWASGLARGVADRYGVRGADVGDLVGAAQLMLVQKWRSFDRSRCPPDGDLEALFRGWSHISIYRECIGEVRRLAGGGLIRRRRRVNVVCGRLGDRALSLLSAAGEREEESLEGQPATAPITLQDLTEPLEEENREIHTRQQLRAVRSAGSIEQLQKITNFNLEFLNSKRLDRRRFGVILQAITDKRDSIRQGKAPINPERKPLRSEGKESWIAYLHRKQAPE